MREKQKRMFAKLPKHLTPQALEQLWITKQSTDEQKPTRQTDEWWLFKFIQLSRMKHGTREHATWELEQSSYPNILQVAMSYKATPLNLKIITLYDGARVLLFNKHEVVQSADFNCFGFPWPLYNIHCPATQRWWSIQTLIIQRSCLETERTWR